MFFLLTFNVTKQITGYKINIQITYFKVNYSYGKETSKEGAGEKNVILINTDKRNMGQKPNDSEFGFMSAQSPRVEISGTKLFRRQPFLKVIN